METDKRDDGRRLNPLNETANYSAGMSQQQPERSLSIVTAISMAVQVTLFGVATIGVGEINRVKVKETGFICVSQALMKRTFEVPE